LGRIHARLASSLPDVELAAVVDSIPRQAEQVAAEHGAKALSDYHDVIGLADAAVIATPTVTHHAVGMELLENGLHVFIEKPLAPSTAEAQELVAAAESRGLTLQVGHVERFNPAYTAAAPHLERPQYIDATRTSGYTFRSTDIGAVLDLMIHDIDLALALAESQVERVDALGVSIFGGHEDMAQARLTFANGCVANLTASRASYVACRRMQVFSAASFAALDFAAPSAKLVRPSPAMLAGEMDFEHLSPEEKQRFRENLFVEHLRTSDLTLSPRNAIQEELREFAASIAGRGVPTVDGRQALHAVAVAERVLEAIANHRWNIGQGNAWGGYPHSAAILPWPRRNLPPQSDAA
jgi:predicted dehydrogenase